MQAFFIEKPMQGVVKNCERPIPADDEVLIKVMAAGLCGTDVHIFKGEYFGTYPRIPGHEFSGIVEQVGKKVKNIKAGQHVAADPNIFCETCEACKENRQNFCTDMHAAGVTRHGAFAQFVTIPERCVFDIGDTSFTTGALIEPLACVVHGQNKAKPPLGSQVLIIGAGPIGLMHAQLAQINGCAAVTIIDPFVEKLHTAKSIGVSHAYTVENFNELHNINAYELVIDCTGIPVVVQNAVKYVKDMGTLLFFGVCPSNSEISINPYEVFKRELNLVGTFALRKTFGAALHLAASGKINLDVLVGSRLLLEEVPACFAAMIAGNSNMKTVVYPNGFV